MFNINEDFKKMIIIRQHTAEHMIKCLANQRINISIDQAGFKKGMNTGNGFSQIGTKLLQPGV